MKVMKFVTGLLIALPMAAVAAPPKEAGPGIKTRDRLPKVEAELKAKKADLAARNGARIVELTSSPVVGSAEGRQLSRILNSNNDKNSDSVIRLVSVIKILKEQDPSGTLIKEAELKSIVDLMSRMNEISDVSVEGGSTFELFVRSLPDIPTMENASNKTLWLKAVKGTLETLDAEVIVDGKPTINGKSDLAFEAWVKKEYGDRADKILENIRANCRK
jgi:hypothetical protein